MMVSPRGASLTGQLMLLIAAVSVPLGLLTSTIIYTQYDSSRVAAEAELVQHARTAAALLDRELEGAQAVARALTASSALRHGDMASFRQELVEASRTYGDGLPAGAQPVMIGLVGQDGNWVVDTGPLGDTAQKHRAPQHAQEAIASGRAQVSDLYIGSLTRQPRISISVPVFSASPDEDGSYRTIGAIGIAISRQRFLDIIAETRVPDGALVSIQDRRGFTVARSLQDAETVGKLPTPMVFASIMRGGAGLAPPGAKTLEGVPSTIAFAHAPKSGFTVAIDVPDKLFRAPLITSLIRAVELGAVVLVAGLGLAFFLARHMVMALHRVVPAAQAAALSGTMPGGLGLRDADDLAGALTRLLLEQRTAAAALAESEAKFRSLADVMPQLVWAASPTGVYDYFNARCYAFSGAAPGALDGVAWHNLTHPEDRAALEAAWREAIGTGDSFEVECRRRRHDGEYRWMLVRAVPMRGASNVQQPQASVVRWFGSSTDITDIVQAREVSARSHAELESLVEERTRDLRDLQSRLAHAARMDALGQLAGGIAHDFNNVLQAILGGVALIDRKPREPAVVSRYARMIFDSAERGSAITQRLLAFSRRSTLHTEIIDPVAMLRDLQEILSHTLGGGIRTEIRTQDAVPSLMADKGQLETVLINLATNARDAMLGKGVILIGATLDIVENPDPAHSAGLAVGSYVCLSVSDTGTGMDAATLERVFEPFFTTKKPGQGTGLGLAMAHGFAGQSGGGLDIESTVGKGTTVKLWLPTADPAALTRAKRKALPSASASHHARLLLVDDEGAIRDLLGGALEAEGFTVAVAGCVEEALRVLDEVAIDLLISDLSMPGADGLTLIREAQLRRPGLPAILITGFAKDETEMAVLGASSGSFSLMRKPITVPQLATRIWELLPIAGTN